MKKVYLPKLITLLCLFVLTVSLKTPALDEVPAPTTIYYAVQYMKVHPTKDHDYIVLETEIWKKLHEARKAAGVLDGWYMFRVLSPSGTDAEYNYITVNVYNTKEKLAGHYESYGVDYTKFLTNEEVATALKTEEIRDMVKEEVWQSEDSVLKANPDNIYKYQRFNAMRLRPGVTGEQYANLEKKNWKPVHTARVKAGKMHGWSLVSMILPGGTDVSYAWGTIDFYDNFVDLFESTDPYLEQVHNAKELKDITNKTLATRDLIKSEVRMLIDHIPE